jgi:transposase
MLALHLALERWERMAIERLLTQPVMHVDETSIRVEKHNHWIHVCSGGDITLKFVHEKLGLEAMAAIGIIPRYGGVIVHDCWASYLSYAHCGHGLCGAHLLRELAFIVEANGYAWAKNMKRLPIPAKHNGKRGRIAKSDAHNLSERLKEHEIAVLLFAKDSNVPFTNNRAERDLRMSKVKQKVSGCFHKAEFAQAYCRISSYLQTMANKGLQPSRRYPNGSLRSAVRRIG